MQGLDPQVAELLETVAPMREVATGDWDAVLRDAQRRKPVRRALVVVPVAAAVALIVLAGLIWPFGSERLNVLQRARAALGYGPVVHVVFRGRRYGELVDLQTGERTLLHERHELWFDPKRGLHELTSVAGVPQEEDWEIAAALSPDQETVYQGFATGYREALDSGKAHVIGKGRVDGRAVYWIRVVPVPIYYKIFKTAFEVAVDSRSFQPILVRQTGNVYPYGPEAGRPQSGERIVKIESASARAGRLDLVVEMSRRGDKELGAGFERLGPQTLANALRQVRGAVWLGRSFEGLPLRETRIEVAEVFFVGEPLRKWRRAESVTVAYWKSRRGRRFVQVTQSARPFGANFSVPPAVLEPLVPPPGKMLVVGRGRAELRVGPLYVSLGVSGNEKLRTLLAAARSLSPIPR